MNERKSLRQYLSQAIIDFRKEPSEKSEKVLLESFVRFLKNVDHIQWRNQEQQLVWDFIALDPNYKLFKNVSSSEITDLIQKRFNLDSLRLYLLSNLRYLPAESDRVALLVDALRTDPSKSNRNWALVMLAQLKWDQAAELAVTLWESKDQEDKSCALKVLFYADSDQLDKFVEKALKIECLNRLGISLIERRDRNRRKESGTA